MPFKRFDRLVETTTTTGTGSLTLAGAITGARTFGSKLSNNDTVPYVLEAIDGSGQLTGEWELGIGTWTTGGTLARTEILDSSNAGSVVNLSAGTKSVYCAPLALLEQVFTLAADATNSSNSTLSDVSGMSFTAAAGGLYEIEVIGWARSAATTTGMWLGFNTPASPTLISGLGFTVGSTSGTPVSFSQAADDTVTSVGTSFLGTGADHSVILRATLFNGANAGTVQLRMRSEVNSSQVTLKQNSLMIVRRIG